MRFEWNEQKRRDNIRKHGFDFRDARKVFNLPMLVALDDRKEYGEDRLDWNRDAEHSRCRCRVY